MSENSFKTEQEVFWANDFGNDYIQRNCSQDYLTSNLLFFSKIITKVGKIGSILEFGTNIGMNLRALKQLLPSLELNGIEINANAYAELIKLTSKENVFHGSALEYVPNKKCELVLSKGFLIHINPEELNAVYSKMYDSSSRYILICVYYNPTPVTVSYRGHSERLFKRDFAGEMMEQYSDLKLIDYGFLYKNDPSFPQDDINWFLLEKSN